MRIPVTALVAGFLLLGLSAPGSPSSGPEPPAVRTTSAACSTSSYVPSMSPVTLEDGTGGTLLVKHSRSKARTVEYSLNGGGPFELDVEETLIAGGDPSIAGGDVRFELVTRLGLETWDGEVRSARLTKVVMTVCPPWSQTAGPDIDL